MSHAQRLSGFAIPGAARCLPVLVAIACVATALALLTTVQAGAALAYAGQHVPWRGLLRAQLVDWYAYAIFLPALLWLARRHPIGRATWQRALPWYLLLALPIALGKETIYVTIGNAFRPGVFSLPTILSEDFSSEVVTAWALIGLAHAFASQGRAGDASAGGKRGRESKSAVHIAVRVSGAYRLVQTAEIEWIDSQGNYARLITREGGFLVRETMAELERRLTPAFLRVHRRLLVNLDKLDRIEPRSHGKYWLHLKSGERITSSRSYNARIRSLI